MNFIIPSFISKLIKQGPFILIQIFIFQVIFFLLSLDLIAQPSIAWKKCFSGKMGDNEFSMCEEGDRNLCGSFIWLLKNDMTGSILWQNNYVGDDYYASIIRTLDGGFKMAG